MPKLDYEPYFNFLSENVMTPFYNKRLQRLNELKLNEILQYKNPYLFKAKHLEVAGDLVKSILDAYLSSQEETMFGNLLEVFAIFISHNLYGGIKSEFKSVDLEFRRENIYYIVGIKSGPNWGNSDQISQMRSSLKIAKEMLRQNGITDEIVAVNGCIYGKDRNPFKKHKDPEKVYYKYCGQAFWHFISDDDDLYREIITPIDKEAKQKDEAFKTAYAKKINQMTEEFIENFTTDYKVDWIKLIDFVSKRA
jgi:hypothetical protein